MKNFPPDGNPYPNDRDWQPEIPSTDEYVDIINQLPPRQPDASAFFSLVFYLVPIIGVFPSLWTLYYRDGTREQMTISRLSITLTLTWVIGYLLFATGVESSNFAEFRLLILNSFFTSSYFLVSVWLIFKTLKGKTQRLPGISPLSRRIFKK